MRSLGYLTFLCAIALPLAAAQRWYYTGNFQNEQQQERFFPGHVVRLDELFSPSAPHTHSHNNSDYSRNTSINNASQLLYCGGLVLVPDNDNGTAEGLVDEEALSFLGNVTRERDSERDTHALELLSAHKYLLQIARNYADPQVVEQPREPLCASDEERERERESESEGVCLASSHTHTLTTRTTWATVSAEIGLYDGQRGVFVKREWQPLVAGELFAVVARDADGREHRVLFTTDMYRRRSLIAHTWREPATAHRLTETAIGATGEESIETESERESVSLRVMTYNLWHNNPPSWVYGNKKKRWQRYSRRMRHFAETIVRSRAEVVTLQEVRLDGAFFAVDHRVPLWRNSSQSKQDGGLQIEHLLSCISLAREELGVDDKWEFQVLFHPAMSMWERGALATRNEEGVLILSRYPILNAKALLLPREIGNPADDHQRVVLTVQIDVRGVIVTVATSHLSLMEKSRDISADEILNFFDSDASVKQSPIHVLTGDFNAEPHEQAIRHLVRGNYDREGTLQSGFVDAWSHLHTSEGFTFPTCNPVKRIDFLLVRNNSLSEGKHTVTVRNVAVVGEDPTEDTVHLVASREGLGMNDHDSPIWASDHMAVIADLVIDSKIDH